MDKGWTVIKSEEFSECSTSSAVTIKYKIFKKLYRDIYQLTYKLGLLELSENIWSFLY